MKHKIAVFRSSRITEKEFMGFHSLECKEEEVEKEIDKATEDYHVCDCDWMDEFDEFECECWTWAVQVPIDVVKYDWYTDKFYTQQEIEEEKKEKTQRKIRILKETIRTNNETISKLLEENIGINEKIIELLKLSQK